MRQYYSKFDCLMCILFFYFMCNAFWIGIFKILLVTVDISDLDLILKGQAPRI